MSAKSALVNAGFGGAGSFNSHEKSSFGQPYNNSTQNSRYYNANHNSNSTIKSFVQPNNVFGDASARIGSSGRRISPIRQRSSPNRSMFFLYL